MFTVNGKILGSLAIFAVASAIGIGAARTSWNGTIFLSKTSFLLKNRNPAAIRKDVDFSKLDGDELLVATQKRLVSAARVVLHKDDVGIELGHFVTRDANGDRQLACDFYDRVRLRFEAEGVASGGEKPVLEVEGPCRTAGDITRIEPIWIPVQKIIGEKAADVDLTFPDQEGVNFKFREISGEWPRHWRLQSVRLFNDVQGGREVVIGASDLRDLREKPIMIDLVDQTRQPSSAK